MNKRTKRRFGWWLGVILVITAAGCGQYSWRESYRYNKQQPYDLYALYELLEARDAGLVFQDDTLGSLLRDSIRNANFVYVGQDIFLDEGDVTGLLAFVEFGNTAFLGTKNIPEDLIYHFYGPSCFYQQTSGYFNAFEYHVADTISLDLSESVAGSDRNHQADFPYRFRPTAHYWTYVDSAMICDPEYGLEILGTLDSGRINFLRLAWGEGEIYLHTNPELFTNYFLTDSSRYGYAEEVFGVLTNGPVYWNEYARSRRPPPRDGQRDPYQPGGGRQILSDNHGLRYILDQPSLAFAWYLFVAGGLLYLFFRGKRRQRIIPIHHPPENTSLQFVDTVSALARQQGFHRKLARREIKMLRQHLYERYQVRWPEGEPPPVNLAEYTNIHPDAVERARKQIKVIESADWIKENQLLDFYAAIQVFYRV